MRAEVQQHPDVTHSQVLDHPELCGHQPHRHRGVALDLCGLLGQLLSGLQPFADIALEVGINDPRERLPPRPWPEWAELVPG